MAVGSAGNLEGPGPVASGDERGAGGRWADGIGVAHADAVTLLALLLSASGKAVES
jgi:hypothetical protein